MVRGVIHGARTMVGIREAVYRNAAANAGSYSAEHRSESIDYNQEGGLVIKIYFPSKEAAAKFVTKCETKLPWTSPGRVVLERIRCGRYKDIPIEAGHYDASEGTCPSQSGIASVPSSGTAVSVTSSSVPNSYGVSMYQAIQPAIIHEGAGFQLCRILPSYKCTGEYASAAEDPNNFLALSPSCHKYFDQGRGGGGRVAKMGISVHHSLSHREDTRQ